MNRPLGIQKQLNRKADSNVAGNIFYALMTKCNQQYSEVKKMPLPMAISLLNNINEENRQAKKEQGKIGRKRR